MADWGDSILLTVEEIRALGQYATPPSITGLDYTDTDYQHLLHAGGALSFSLDEGSAEDEGHDPEDLRIILRVPGIDQETCDLDAEVDWPGLNFAHAERVGIYGPEPALAHDDWVGSSGATSPTSAGEFTVSGASAALTLAIPSGYGSRLDAIPAQNFPTGMPGLPEMGYYHRADVWREYDGELGQDGNPYSVPAEGVYCWRGFSYLEVPLSGCNGQAMTLSITARQHSITDNHLSDSTRQEDAEHSYSEIVRTVRAVAGSTSVVFPLALADQESDPDYEEVTEIVLSGFATGDLVIGEPELTADETAGTVLVKVFEGKDYQEGGFSAVVSPSHKYALMDDAEGNGGHDTQAEKTVRLFDYIEGATTGADLTTAYSLASMAGILHNVCDAWECTVNQTALDAATLDEDDSRLSNCWGFDACHPDCVTVDADDRTYRPLIQGAPGTLNCSLRCGTWNIVGGVLCAVRTDMVAGGAAHGLARSGSSLVRSQTGALTVWRRKNGGEDADWEEFQTGIDIDAYGMWHSGSLQEFNPDDDLRWEYGISPAGAQGPTGVLGNAYLREYVTLAIASAQGRPQDICQDEHDRTWCVYYDAAGAVQCQGADMGRSQPIWEAATEPFGAATGYTRPRVTCGPRGRLVVTACNAGTQEIAVSDDMGANWADLTGSVATGLQAADIAIGEHDELAIAGWTGSAVKFRLTTQTDYAVDPLTGATTELTVCAAVGNDPPVIALERVTRGVWAVLVEGIGLYIVQAYSNGFSAVTGTHLADGLTYADLAVSEHDELGCAGYDSVADAVVFRATTQTDWTADPLTGASTELTVCDASGATDGPYVSLAGIARGAWLVGVDDGSSAQAFYRLRSPATGFEELAT
jgi:hypothetical protein